MSLLQICVQLTPVLALASIDVDQSAPYNIFIINSIYLYSVAHTYTVFASGICFDFNPFPSRALAAMVTKQRSRRGCARRSEGILTRTDKE